MHLFGERQRAMSGRPVRGSSLFLKLKSAAAVSCLLAGTAPGYAWGYTLGPGDGSEPAQAQEKTPANPAGTPNTQGLPTEPPPSYTQPLYMRPSARDYS